MFQKIKNIYHLLRALLANCWYGFPSRKLHVIGVTGTDGKTTTTHLIYHILSSSGKKVSMISTIYAKIGEAEYDTGFHVTTPDASLVPRYLKMAVDRGQEYFVLETTSHRLDQNQLFGTDFRVGVITNITHEHLDYHKTIEEYARTKMKLIRKAKVGIMNEDDPVTRNIILNSKFKIKNFKTYGLKQKADYSIDFRKELPNLTDFNAYNYLAAYTVCRELGVSDKQIRAALSTFTLPAGRIDIVYDKDYKVIVDFAHTPNAIAQILESIRKIYVKSGGKLIHIFGSAGLRDHSKRFAMGQASGRFADTTILTEEDYRTEDPAEICRQIGLGLGDKRFETIIDREKAIAKGISYAKKGDVVIITGKGHEKSLCRGRKEYPWSDRECVLELVEKV